MVFVAHEDNASFSASAIVAGAWNINMNAINKAALPSLSLAG
jgi:hypothetical protein